MLIENFKARSMEMAKSYFKEKIILPHHVMRYVLRVMCFVTTEWSVEPYRLPEKLSGRYLFHL